MYFSFWVHFLHASLVLEGKIAVSVGKGEAVFFTFPSSFSNFMLNGGRNSDHYLVFKFSCKVYAHWMVQGKCFDFCVGKPSCFIISSLQ